MSTYQNFDHSFLRHVLELRVQDLGDALLRVVRVLEGPHRDGLRPFDFTSASGLAGLQASSLGLVNPLEPLAVEVGDLREDEFDVVEREGLPLVVHAVADSVAELDVLQDQDPGLGLLAGEPADEGTVFCAVGSFSFVVGVVAGVSVIAGGQNMVQRSLAAGQLDLGDEILNT